MAMRITTGAILSNYRRNLNKSLSNRDSAMNKVLTKRNFNSISEDPAAASKAFKLRRDAYRNDDYLSNLEDAEDIYEGVETSATQIKEIMKDIKADILSAVSDTSSEESRKTYATKLRESMESIVLAANATFGDKFILGGKETGEVPFKITNDGKLTYRGIDVNTTDPAEMDKLKELAGEKLYTDLGFGLREDGGQLQDNSAFNVSVPGINILGYGNYMDKDSHGNDMVTGSKNVVTLLGQMADILEDPNFDMKKFDELSTHFTDSYNQVVDSLTQIGVQTKFLSDTKDRLTANGDILNNKIVSVENVDLADAITNYSWAQYSYNAALKVGNSVLSPSFIDFMS